MDPYHSLLVLSVKEGIISKSKYKEIKVHVAVWSTTFCVCRACLYLVACACMLYYPTRKEIKHTIFHFRCGMIVRCRSHWFCDKRSQCIRHYVLPCVCRLCVHSGACMRACVRACVRTYLPTYLPTYIPTYLHTTYILHTCACACGCACACACACACTCVV